MGYIYSKVFTNVNSILYFTFSQETEIKWQSKENKTKRINRCVYKLHSNKQR